ncbi:MAG: hypothetical protein R2825_22545 [Saprospiraceae bacterium]
MDLTLAVMWVGFFLASYSVVGNDVIQTLGTFLTSNEKTMKWWVLWLFAATILSAALINGYTQDDISYGRLEKFRESLQGLHYSWYYMLPPLVLMVITRWGIPVSTTFMILTLFSLSDIPNDMPTMLSSVFDSDTRLGGMIEKSVLGYIVAFISGTIIYVLITRMTEKRFIDNPPTKVSMQVWTVLQWCSTGFLWYQWLSQDLANIYVYLRGGYDMSVWEFVASLLILVILLGYIFYQKGGAVQDVVRKKTNTADIRSATFIDFIYAMILMVFKGEKFFGLGFELPWTGNLPMSTTWVFIGLLAGREIGMRLNLEKTVTKKISKMIFADLGKVFFGLIVSVVLVFIIKLLAG